MEPRNVTGQTRVMNAPKYQQVEYGAFEKGRQSGNWLMSLIATPFGFLWGIAEWMGRTALAWVGIGLLFLGAYFSTDNFCLLMWKQTLKTFIDAGFSQPSIWMLLCAAVVTAAVEMAEYLGWNEFQKQRIYAKTRGGQARASIIVAGGIAMLLEILSLLVGFWINGGANEAISWISLILASAGVKIGIMMLQEYRSQNEAESN